MKLTTKRNRRFFRRELFSYMIPMILMMGCVDVFISFMQCSLHPEWSAPCNIYWLNAVMYGLFLILVILLSIISARRLRKIKNQIGQEFLDAANQGMNTEVKKLTKVDKKPRKEIKIKSKQTDTKIKK